MDYDLSLDEIKTTHLHTVEKVKLKVVSFGALPILLTDVADIPDAFSLIGQMLGSGFGYLFAMGLLLSGQSSTITGTMAGQIVMEGFLGSQFKVKPWVRRLITRLMAVIPALICIFVFGEQKLNDLLILSQIILSLQLPFAVWPLLYFTSRKDIMTVRYRQYSSTDLLSLMV
jgi:manganese transport protein